MAAAIKQLRQDCGLTQVDFAVALGLTPASIYRYEVGTTRPSPKTLSKLRSFAADHDNRAAEHIFNRAIHLDVGLSQVAIPFAFTDQVFEIFEAHATSLTHQELVLVLAFIQLLADRTKRDQSVYNALRALLIPYMVQAEKNLKGVLFTESAPGKTEPSTTKKKS